MSQSHKFAQQSVAKSFFQYLIPSLVGMALLSINIVIDGIFVGHGVGSTALAGVNIASPVFSIILSVGLLIGVGGGAIYSLSLGQENEKKAQQTFTLSMLIVTIVTVIVGSISFLFMEKLALFFGANSDTLPFVIEYMRVLLVFSLFMVWETSLSVFIRNDGNPNLAMIGLATTSILNIGLNYWMIFILEWGVSGAALATVISIVVGILIYGTHFLKKSNNLKFVRITFNWPEIQRINAVGFPSFLSEIGMGVFVIGYNVVIAYHAGTNGLAAFSVINYLHTFMFLVFLGIGSAVQPMISYYYGAKRFDQIKELMRLAEKTAIGIGALFFVGGFFGATYLVSLFGVTSDTITEMAVLGIRIFFASYFFMGINFLYMTYFQSIGHVRPSILITMARSFIVFGIMLLILPYLFGLIGVWLVLPVTELLVFGFLIGMVRKNIVGAHVNLGIPANYKPRKKKHQI